MIDSMTVLKADCGMNEQNETRCDPTGAEARAASEETRANPMSKPRGVARFSDWLNTLGPLLALACVIGLFAVADRVWADGTFATGRNLRTVTVQTCVVAVAALGMTIIIISGGIDLSVGSTIALGSMAVAWVLRAGGNPWLAIGAGFATALLCGAVIGALVIGQAIRVFVRALAV